MWGVGMLKLYYKLKPIIKKIMDDQITVYSAQASFYLIISAFPFTMLFLSLAGYFITVPKQSIISLVQSFLPEAVGPAVAVVAQELFDKSISVISFTAVAALWSSSRGISAVCRGVRKVYNTPERSSFIAEHGFALLYTVVFIGILILTLILQVFGDLIMSFVSRYIIFNIEDMSLIKGVSLFVLMSVIFQLMYYFFDRRKINFKNHFCGAVFCAAGWMIFSGLFSVYINNFGNYSYIYGSLTAVVLLMLWTYFCVMILLLGAELNGYIYNIKKSGEKK